ncbi:PREDICTED: fas-associated death domain protein [Acromyrmex echinatior]|nr:PREDICTED: fas-associated death domain protein [Acromyrmex echinatior]
MDFGCRWQQLWSRDPFDAKKKRAFQRRMKRILKVCRVNVVIVDNRTFYRIPLRTCFKIANLIWLEKLSLWKYKMFEKYTLLCQDFLSIAEPFIDSNILNQMKCNYAHEIDSKRKLSQIKDLKKFIRLLEKRDIMSYSNIEPLWCISKKYIHKSDLESKLQEYESWLEAVSPLSLCNIYQSEVLVPSLASKSCSEHACNSMLSQLLIENSTKPFSSSQTLYCNSEQKEHYNLYERRKLQEAVMLQVKDRLGRSWRDVARHLGITECEIDAIQNKYPYDLKEQSYEILKIYILQSDTEQWAINLIRALEKGRRRDIKELVEELILKNRNI